MSTLSRDSGRTRGERVGWAAFRTMDARGKHGLLLGGPDVQGFFEKGELRVDGLRSCQGLYAAGAQPM